MTSSLRHVSSCFFLLWDRGGLLQTHVREKKDKVKH